MQVKQLMSLRSSSGGFDTSARHRGRVHGWLGVRPWVARGAVKVSVPGQIDVDVSPDPLWLEIQGQSCSRRCSQLSEYGV